MKNVAYYHRFAQSSLLVMSIYSSDSWDNVIDVKHCAIVIQAHFRRYRQYHVRLFFIFFSSIYAVVKQTLVLSSTPHKEPVTKLALRVFLKNTMT